MTPFQQAQEIRQKRNLGVKLKDLSKEYGVSMATISLISRNKSRVSESPSPRLVAQRLANLAVGRRMKHKNGAAWNKGLTMPSPSPETLAKRSVSIRKALEKYHGKNHWNYTGTTPVSKKIRTSTKYQEWRTACFIRDGRKCVKCGSSENINCHHKTSLGEILLNLIKTHGEESLYERALDCALLWDTGNGETLCETHHKETDTYAMAISRK